MTATTLDRRRLLKGATALMIGFNLPRVARAANTASPVALNAWVRIGADDRVTLILSQCEIGQGITTTLPAILADELGADWAKVDTENAPVVSDDYRNPRLTGCTRATAKASRPSPR